MAKGRKLREQYLVKFSFPEGEEVAVAVWAYSEKQALATVYNNRHDKHKHLTISPSEAFGSFDLFLEVATAEKRTPKRVRKARTKTLQLPLFKWPAPSRR